MAWDGYYMLGGTEVINVARTETYARNAGLAWFKPQFNNDALGPMLGQAYTMPFADEDTPWTDKDVPASYGFYGAYPLGISGVEDATATATVTESTLDGGVVGRVRRATRTVVMNLVLIGADECAVDYGLRWLKEVAAGGVCSGRSDQSCNVGSDLCYLACPPLLDWAGNTADLEDCLDPYLRELHKVAVTVGPTVTGKAVTTDGGCAWTVSVTMVAGNPYEFGTLTPLVLGFGDPHVTVPYADGVIPPGAAFDVRGFNQVEAKCPVPVFRPVTDPACAPIVAPPPVPSISLNCFTFPVNYLRRSFTIPDQSVPLWGDVVPVFRIHTQAKEVRTLRLRFYADPDGDRDITEDPCNFCGDIVFSYIPPNSTLVFDAADRVTYVESTGGVRRRADALVFGSGGGPFDWPALSCGHPYVVTLDLPTTNTMPIVDMLLATRAA